MSAKHLSGFTQAVVIALWQVFSQAPSFALDREVAAKKELCHTCLKNIYVAQRNVPAAMAEYQALLVLTPNDANLHFDYANFLITCQRIPLASVQYQAAARLNPNVAEFQAGMGNAFMYTKKYSAAVSAYTRACQLGGKFEKQLQMAQQYEAQTKQLIQYEKKEQEKKDEDEE